jgi:hypothetical protein
MSCNNCPEGVVKVPVDTDAWQEPHSQVQTDVGIPIKVGEPLSSACERATIVGSIPEVIRYPWFTKIGGGVFASTISNGGIQNTKEFFSSKKGCYEDRNARLASTCC